MSLIDSYRPSVVPAAFSPLQLADTGKQYHVTGLERPEKGKYTNLSYTG